MCPVILAATPGASIPLSETIRRSPHFLIEQQDIKRMVPEHWHSSRGASAGGFYAVLFGRWNINPT